VPQAMGLPQAFADLVIVVPFNDLDAVRRAFEEHPGQIAGMFVEPAMMNCGVILPEEGYLAGLKEICHANGAYLAFDEVKTGATLAYGGATEVFGVVPDIICLAKAIGGGLPCGAIGATRELYRPVLEDEYDMAGTFNGNPLTMAASRAALTQVLVGDVYDDFNRIDEAMKAGLRDVIARTGLPAYVSGVGAKGSVIYSTKPVREYRDAVGIDERISYLAWLFQQNRGVFKSPWTKQETWTLSVWHTEDDAARYVENFAEFATAVTGG
jgi:glutamate-1-semialdehyde 2,1-aminomutase